MKNKVVWITGASSGIGEALVYAYDKAGAKLILSSRNRDELYRVKRACKSPVNIHVLPLDLENTVSLADKAEEALRIYGHVDLLINSGGISQRSLALETTLQTEQRLMSVNFWGTVMLSKAVLPNMIAKGGGKIVCISSLVGKFGTRLRSSYAASKHALHGYFDSLRAEVFDKNIQITLICPGFVKTNVTLNALTANGAPYGINDHGPETGISPEECAKQIVSAINANKEEVYIGGKEVKAVLFKRLFPLRFSKYLRTAKVT
ncbi:MAG: SDR family oxidoreductase [Candidatus Pedobacter colombiensis]|uniref:SDR family oxidoreductase n=1 Tax=Candidatus Pedobacter colombiensis TaxID=3121371 RepID=A0AAJ5W6M5_9SPHI|nr:SDR family oxidoreductase [Pedobacter sp.]WEK18997.1 MAG: SDR family oxidoreductase [Pedobacter sp.]